MSPGPHVWIDFSLRTLVRSLWHLPARFRTSYVPCWSQPGPGSREPGVMHVSQGMPGLAEARRASQRGGSCAGRAATGTQGRQQRSDQSKALQRQQHAAATQTMSPPRQESTANTVHAAHCYLYHMPYIKNMLHLRTASPRHRDRNGGRRRKERGSLQQARSRPAHTIDAAGNLPVEFNGARKASAANEALSFSWHLCGLGSASG